MKFCYYTTQSTCNLLPAIVVTPMYRIVRLTPGQPLSEYPSYLHTKVIPDHLHCNGVRVCFKFLCFNIGMEYNPE